MGPVVLHDAKLPVEMPHCCFSCIFAEGVVLEKLDEKYKLISSPVPCSEFVVGRNIQAQSLWSTLAPNESLRNLISRSHFKVVGRRKCSQQVTQYLFYIACLSQNGMLLNSKFMLPGSGGSCMQPG